MNTIKSKTKARVYTLYNKLRASGGDYRNYRHDRNDVCNDLYKLRRVRIAKGGLFGLEWVNGEGFLTCKLKSYKEAVEFLRARVVRKRWQLVVDEKLA